MMHRALGLLSTTALVALTALVGPAQADNIQFNTDTGQLILNGGLSPTFFGETVHTSVVDGAMQFRFVGDLFFISTDVVSAVGSRPLSLFAGDDVTIPAVQLRRLRHDR